MTDEKGDNGEEEEDGDKGEGDETNKEDEWGGERNMMIITNTLLCIWGHQYVCVVCFVLVRLHSYHLFSATHNEREKWKNSDT